MKRDSNEHSMDRGAERARWVKRYRASGLGLKRFAARHGLEAGRLHYWVYGSWKPRQVKPWVPVFRELRLAGAGTAPTVWKAEVGLGDGTTVRLVQGTDVEWTRALVESLRRPCSP